MTGIELVVSLVRKLGRASAEDLQDLCPDMTRTQIQKAMGNAMSRGYLESVGLSDKPGSMGIRMMLYEATGKQPPERNRKHSKLSYTEPGEVFAPRGQYGYIGRVSSVWELGGVEHAA